MRYIDTTYRTDVRYDIPKFCNNTEDVFDILDSYVFEKVGFYYEEQISLKDLKVEGIFTVTTQEYRPDKISYEIYKSTQYWWLIMEFNNIIDIFDIIAGLELNYFNITELEDIYFSLNSRQRQQDR
jgi:hypothetical protein